MNGEWRGPRFIGTITRVAHALGQPLAPGGHEPSPLDHVDACLANGKMVACYRGEVIDLMDLVRSYLIALDQDRKSPGHFTRAVEEAEQALRDAATREPS